jgi:hypothetical protein
MQAHTDSNEEVTAQRCLGLRPRVIRLTLRGVPGVALAPGAAAG